jgi:hypothetical protein
VANHRPGIGRGANIKLEAVAAMGESQFESC